MSTGTEERKLAAIMFTDMVGYTAQERARALTLTGQNEQASILQQTYTASGFEVALRKSAEKKLEDLNAKAARGEYVPAAEFVKICIRLGDKEQAFVWLAKAVQERNRLAWELKIDPVFDPLRADPRFEALGPESR